MRKMCTRCRIEKAIEDFSRRENSRDGFQGVCKDCIRARGREFYLKNRDKYRKDYEENRDARRLRMRERYKRCREEVLTERRLKKYNITAERLEVLKTESGGVCAICGESRPLVLDHSHACCESKESCGKCVRGFLCSKCNTALGMFGDNILNLENAITYLESYATTQSAVA